MNAIIAPIHLQAKLHIENPSCGRLVHFIEILNNLKINVKFPRKNQLESELKNCDLLITTTRLIKYPYEDWELKLFQKFVESKGSLLHMSNHDPFPKNDSQLGELFGYRFLSNTYKNQSNSSFFIKINYEGTKILKLDMEREWLFCANNCCSIEIQSSSAVIIATLPSSIIESKTGNSGHNKIFAIAMDLEGHKGRIIAISDSGLIGEPTNSNPGPGLKEGDNYCIFEAIIKWLIKK